MRKENVIEIKEEVKIGEAILEVGDKIELLEKKSMTIKEGSGKELIPEFRQLISNYGLEDFLFAVTEAVDDKTLDKRLVKMLDKVLDYSRTI